MFLSKGGSSLFKLKKKIMYRIILPAVFPLQKKKHMINCSSQGKHY